MKSMFLSAVLGAATLGGAALADQAVQGQVLNCTARVHAPGSYEVIRSSATVPSVQPAFGGTIRGAANVNDCLRDIYQVQYGAAAYGGAESAPSAKECKGLRRVFTSCVSDEIYADTGGLVYGCRRNSSPLIRGSNYCRSR
ncbi:hypothetical protein E4Z66_13210 [Aliishimia ponticola]|uniref:Secreted protein n=1 Tax=Aliishimia ponticola TaxID=2499833 RepID=A0A4S4N9Y9_9RHOB|nr:hypothetical protein [Aliishimia ponticola]THH36019.1 hypothetical protein E4Z66_13210 [Aliishimia ponticola]